METLTAVVPFYNEEKLIEQSVERLMKIKEITSVFLVDDFSTDESLLVAKRLADKYPKISIHEKKTNQGKGSCLNFIKDSINTTHVIVHDADLEYNPSDIPELFKLAKDNPSSLILGSRVDGKAERKNIYKFLAYGTGIIAYTFSKLHSYRVSDIATCYLLYPTKFLDSISINEKGFGIEVEILSKFLKYNRSIIEHPISYNARSYEEGKKITIMDGLLIFFKVLKYRF